MSKVLEKARLEEEARRKASYDELKKLEQIVKDKNIKEEVASAVHRILEDDVKKIGDLNEVIQHFSLHPALKFNKLTEIFKCTEDVVNNALEEAVGGTLLTRYPIDQSSVTVLYGTKDTSGQIVNYSGTSKPNCIQNTYLLVLRAVTNAQSIGDIYELQQMGIYSVNTSPNLQTTKLPNAFNSSPYKSWFYYYQDEKSPTQGEVLIPHLGYAFGGSRVDYRYAGKAFKAEDCSSAVAKWLGASEPFTTASMKAVYDNNPSCDSFCQSAKEVLIPVANSGVGYLFFFPGHTGVVSALYNGGQVIETLSYSRDMPHVEGLGYKNYSYTEKTFLFFQEERPLVSESQNSNHEEL